MSQWRARIKSLGLLSSSQGFLWPWRDIPNCTGMHAEIWIILLWSYAAHLLSFVGSPATICLCSCSLHINVCGEDIQIQSCGFNSELFSSEKEKKKKTSKKWYLYNSKCHQYTGCTESCVHIHNEQNHWLPHTFINIKSVLFNRWNTLVALTGLNALERVAAT